MNEPDAKDLLSRIVDLEAENKILKADNEEQAKKIKTLEAGYRAVDRTAGSLRSEYDAGRRRIAKLEKEAKEAAERAKTRPSPEDMRRYRDLERLWLEVDAAQAAGLIDSPEVEIIVQELRGGKDASRNRSG